MFTHFAWQFNIKNLRSVLFAVEITLNLLFQIFRTIFFTVSEWLVAVIEKWNRS
jgi:hypothetical protein